jgi:hypothetical protein
LLCPLHQGKQSLSLIWPKGNHFDFVVGIPRTNHVVLSGDLVVSRANSRLTNINFTTEQSTEANWLHSGNLTAYIVTLPSNKPPIRLDQLVHDGQLINIECNVTNLPVENTNVTFWICYLE